MTYTVNTITRNLITTRHYENAIMVYNSAINKYNYVELNATKDGCYFKALRVMNK